MSPPKKRCAIYTRKSTEDGLDQDFNSLDAQRESCEAFIASQRSEGWACLSTRYDDGGVSGGSLDRAAIQRLLDDVDHGSIDVVVVYKIDRLTRSLADFARIVDRFDAKGVSFVSVTQQFNTSTSMGRLTLNVLLSFAQFEREVTAERIRDKIAASKKKGMWMGGYTPLGYDAIDRKLVINKKEAQVVKLIYEEYNGGATVKTIAADLDAKNIRSKSRKNGKGEKKFSRGTIYKILSNPVYCGQIAHGKLRYEGEHEAIIDRQTWEKTADRLEAGKRREGAGVKHPSPLAGKIWADGEPLTPTHANKNGRRYRYYVSRSLVETGASDTAGWRLPASEVETAVSELIREWLKAETTKNKKTSADTIDGISDRKRLLVRLYNESLAASNPDLLKIWSSGIRKVEITDNKLLLKLDLTTSPAKPHLLGENKSSVNGDESSNGYITIQKSIRFARRGIGRKLIVDDTKLNPDPTLISLMIMVRQWRQEIFNHRASLKDLAARDKVDQGDASRFLPLAFLAPELTLAILEGRQPRSLTAEKLKRLSDLPLDWTSQQTLLAD